MSTAPPPTKKPRRSPGRGSSRGSQQLTITGMLLRQTMSKRSTTDSHPSDVVILDDSTKSEGSNDTGQPTSMSKSRDCSPELFSDPLADDCERVSPDHEVSGTKNSRDVIPVDVKEVEVDHNEPSVSHTCSSEDAVSPSVHHKSPSVSTRSSTRSPDVDLPPCDGAPLSEIHFGPSTYPILPPLQSTASHAVLFRPRLKPGEPPTPFPDKFKDVWDSNHVRMPCSSQSVFPVASSAASDKTTSKTLVSRWDIIKESLRKPINNSYDLEEAILTYNTRRWNFYGLHSYFNDHCSEDETKSFFGSVLPRVVELALSLPTLVTHALPLLKKQLDYSISLSQQQVACLLANAFLCTFPRRNARGATSEYSKYPSTNFNTLFSGHPKQGVSSVTANKLTCIFHYFTRSVSTLDQTVLYTCIAQSLELISTLLQSDQVNANGCGYIPSSGVGHTSSVGKELIDVD